MLDDFPPRIGDAPGLVWRERRENWLATWQARTDIVARGYPVKTRKIARVSRIREPDFATIAMIQDQCQQLQDEMLAWARGGIHAISHFDGTLRGLIRAYQSDDMSSYAKLRYNTRKNYNNILHRIDNEHGDERVADIKGRMINTWYADWVAGAKIDTAHQIIGMLRTIFSFGFTLLEDPECERVRNVLRELKFKVGRSRDEALTAEQVVAIRKKAHEHGQPSIALAQAFQFECTLRQKDVIGEWVPLSEPGTSEVTRGNSKWLRGIRWSEIDQNMILRHITSKRQKEVVVDLKKAPMVMEELQGLLGRPETGPIVISENTARPYTADAFRRFWRIIADDAGIPKNVKNMDTRAGAISEATNAGATLEDVRHAATHSNISMTQRYSRGAEQKIAKVLDLRAASRNKA